MTFTSLAKRLAVAGLLLALALVPSCSKKSNPVAPGSKELNSGNIAPSGGMFAHTFNTAGTYPYHCSIHNVMKGTVIVDPASANMNVPVSIVSATTGGFSPASVTVKTGGTVTWTNNNTSTHTVTSD